MPTDEFLEMFADELYNLEHKYGLKLTAVQDGARELELYDYESSEFCYVRKVRSK